MYVSFILMSLIAYKDSFYYTAKMPTAYEHKYNIILE